MSKKSIVKAISFDEETVEILKIMKEKGLNVSRTIRLLISQFAKNGYNFNLLADSNNKLSVEFVIDEETMGRINHAKEQRAIDMNSAFRKFIDRFHDDDYEFK